MDAFYKDFQGIQAKMLAFQGESSILKECHSCEVVLAQSLGRAVKQSHPQMRIIRGDFNKGVFTKVQGGREPQGGHHSPGSGRGGAAPGPEAPGQPGPEI